MGVRIYSVGILCAVVATAGTGCGGSDGNKLTPLTAAQTAEVQATVSSAVRTSNATQAAQPSAGTSSSLQSAFTAMLTPNLKTTDSSGDDSASAPQTGAMKQMAAKFQDPTVCQVTATTPSAPADPSSTTPLNPFGGMNGNTEISVGGSGCPATADFKISMSSNGTSSMNLSVSMKYAVAPNQPDFEALNDVDNVDFAFTMSANGSSNGGSANGTAKGSIHSQKYGTVKIDGSVNASAQQGSGGQESATITLTYPDFTAVIGVTATIDGNGNSSTPSYTLNGQSVSQDQIQQLLSSANQ